MAHFAKVENGTVIDIAVINNEVITDKDGIEKESLGQEFLLDLLGGLWVQCSYNGNPINGEDRGAYPGPGWKWDGSKFFVPQEIQNDII